MTAEADSRIWVRDFNDEAAQKFNDKVLKIAEKDEKEPVVIYINSYGGYVDSLASMVSVLDSVPNPIITIATGMAMSCGSILLSHGDRRCIGPHARVMIHECSGGTYGNINDAKADVKELARLNDYFMEILARNCGMTLRQLKKKFTNERREIWLTAQQALAFGVADEIGIPGIDKEPSYAVQFHRRHPRRK